MLKTKARKGCDYISKDELLDFWTMSHVIQETKPNSSLDQEAGAIERIRELRKRRGGVLSALTAKRKEIDSLLTDENNLEAVKVKLTEITSLFQRFTDAHEEYNAALIDESQR